MKNAYKYDILHLRRSFEQKIFKLLISFFCPKQQTNIFKTFIILSYNDCMQYSTNIRCIVHINWFWYQIFYIIISQTATIAIQNPNFWHFPNRHTLSKLSKVKNYDIFVFTIFLYFANFGKISQCLKQISSPSISIYNACF